ncbi:MAG: response regulator transcription factor [Terriglobia bacterium]
MNKGTILVVEDEENIASLVSLYLKREGFDVYTAANGEDGLKKLTEVDPRLVILDLMLPDHDGLEVCKRIRADRDLPVIMLTAKDTEIDKILGLEVGADDYMTKPFSPRELVARVKAVLRRLDSSASAEDARLGDVVVNVDRREVMMGEEKIELTAKEFDLLYYFTQNKGLVLSREQILRQVWGYDYYGGARTVDVHIRQLRRKFGDDLPIKTVWGVGYKAEKDV